MLSKKVVTLQLEGDKTPFAHKIFINNVIIFMNFTLLITVMLTAVTLVVAAYVLAKLIGPRTSVTTSSPSFS